MGNGNLEFSVRYVRQSVEPVRVPYRKGEPSTMHAIHHTPNVREAGFLARHSRVPVAIYGCLGARWFH
jgi:hypothetical protein